MRVCALIGAVVCLAAVPGTADAARGLELGFSDPVYRSSDRGPWLERTVDVGAGQVKMFVAWSSIARSQPEDAADPSDPAYSFGGLDESVRAATGRGLDVLLGVQGTPQWAEGDGRPGWAPAGTWKPDPDATGDFMAALATRYSGAFPDPAGAGTLPRVEALQLWNEQNLTTYFTPQWDGKKLVAARHYKKMLNATYRAVKQANPATEVVTGGLAPYGDDPGGARSRPLRFWREVLCLKNRRLKAKKRCGSKAKFDVLAHHAINTSGPPRQGAAHPDDASSGDLRAVKRTLRAAERKRTVGGRQRHPLWVTELWWESKPPSERGYPLRKQARFIEETLYLSWKAGFSRAIQLRIRDGEPTDSLGHRYADGLYFRDGRAKPAVRAFRFPFVAEKRKRRKVKLWGLAPGKGRVVIQRKRGKRWKRVERLRAGGNRVFKGKTGLRGKPKLRAKAGGEKSLVWRVR